jgi:predicted aconitase
MALLVKYGKALGAERLIATNNVCGGAVGSLPNRRDVLSDPEDMDAAFSIFNLDSDEVFTIPPVQTIACKLIEALDPDYYHIQGVSEETRRLVKRNESFCARIGMQLNNTCAPYLVGNVPVFGEHCAWMESSAVVYCNAILGGRTNVEGAQSAGAAMLVGKIPYWGYHITENRYGTHLIEVEYPVENIMDWGLLGYYVGEMVQEKVPVLNGVHSIPDLAKLKHCGASAASSGGVEMYHIVGRTPEAQSLDMAFGTKTPEDTISFRLAERKIAYDHLNSGTDTHVDFIMLGCPHYSLAQIGHVCRLLEGKKISGNTQLWIFTPKALKVVADRMGYTEIITRSGAYLMTDTCPAIARISPEGVTVAATDSCKQAHYLPATLSLPTWFGSVEDCVDAAITGRWRGELT